MFENENNENLVVGEDITENTEETVEETAGQVEQIAEEQPEEKVYTKTEHEDAIKNAVAKAVSRRDAKLHKEYQKKYGELETILKAGTQKEDMAEITEDFRKFYEERGVPIPQMSEYSSKDIDTLAAADAKDIISGGLEEVTEELDRLTELGVANMSAREKSMYQHLANYHKTATQMQELSKIGVKKEVYESPEFQNFANQFTSGTPITNIYQLYEKTLDKPQVEQIGSMHNANPGNEKLYTPEEVDRLTPADYKNPKIMQAVRKSMLSW